MSDLVSVIIPCFNQGQFLERAVSSAMAAYDGETQIVVVDDGSTDPRTETYLRRIRHFSPSVELVRKRNGGLSSARNAGLEVAAGRYIQFLDCDDLIIGNKITNQVAHLNTTGDHVSVTNYVLCNEDQSEVHCEGSDVIGAFDLTIDTFLNVWERGFIIPIHCGLFPRELLKSIKFSEDVYGKEDWIFWCSLVGGGNRVSYLPTHGAVYRQHARSMTKAGFTKMGQAWLDASDIIYRTVPNAGDEFLRSARDWYRTFYEVKLGEIANHGTDGPSATASQDNIHIEKERELLNVAASLAREQDPVISVVIPVFNHYVHFLDCLRSLYLQDFSSFEVVIVDDFSSDDRVRRFLSLLSSVGGRTKVLLNGANEGISETQNRGVVASEGRYIAFVDCDDLLPDGALRAIAAAFVGHPDAAYFFSDRLDIDEHGREVRRASYGGYPWLRPSDSFETDLLDGMVASHLKVIRKDAYVDAGGCLSSRDGAQDWDLALRILETGYRFHYIAKPLYHHRIHTGSVTHSDSSRQFRLTNEIRREYADRQLRSEYEFGFRAFEQTLKFVLTRGTGQHWSRTDVGIVTPDTLPETGAEIRRIYGSRQTRIYFENRDSNIQELNTLREWNSYFDIILLRTLHSYVYLTGYLWDQRIARFVFDLPERAILELEGALHDA